MPTAVRDVRSQGQSGKHILAVSFSGLDPNRTCGDRSADHGGGTPGTADACPYRNAAGIELWEARYKDRAAKRAKAYKIVR